MKKRLFAIMLALALVLAAVPALAEGEVAGTPEEPVSDNESVACTHENEPVRYEDNKNGTHKVIYNCGVVKDASVQHTFNDGKCICGAEQPATEQPATNEPAAQQPAASQPEGQQPATNEPSTQQPTDSQSGGQNPLTNGGGEGGSGQPANPPQLTCNHTNFKYEQYDNEADGRYTHHKKVCKDCGIELVKESHQWAETTKKPKTEGNNIPTCTNGGDWTVQCGLCDHVTVFKGSALGHDYDDPTWNWCGVSSATATFRCKRNCGHSEPETASIVRSSINNCGYYTYTATVQFNGQTYTNTRTDYSCRPDWYYDPCYYNNPCGHWGCGDVCTRYSNCVPCQNYRTTFRVGGYNCLATPKTGDVSVIGMALISLAGAGAAIMGKKRK